MVLRSGVLFYIANMCLFFMIWNTFFTISVLPFPLLSSECRKFQTAGNFQGCFCEVIQLSSVLPFIYIQKNWTKEDIRRKVTTKLF